MVDIELEKSDDGVVIQLDDEVEGERHGSDDIFFVNIGQPVPIKSGYQFDPQSLPSHPLAVSERFSLIFVAHSTGFCVVRTNDVVELAKEIEEDNHKGSSGSCIQELSVVDVPIGKVHILALSADSSTLAASVDGDIHFFSVESLLNKENVPSFTCSLDDSGHVHDMRWTRKLKDYYLVLTNCGKLYYGAGEAPLKHVMDDVDAIEWSMKGNSVAVARKNTLSILSSKFKLKLSMSLSFKSRAGDSDVNCSIKVDSIRWVRSDSIILGCFQLTADGKEENYLVLVLTSKDGKITDASSKHTVLYFNDVFEDFSEDIVPFGSGPHLFFSYIDECELAIAANRNNTAQQLTLFGWSVSDENNEAAVIDLLGDSWLPRIELQGNGDENVILALCVDKVSNAEKVSIKLGEEVKELLPYCIVFCVTIEGKLIMFRLASLTGSTAPAEVEYTLSYEEENATAVVPSEHGLSNDKPQFSGQSVEQETNKVPSRKELDEIPVKNDLKFSEVNKPLTNILSDDQVFSKGTVSASQDVRTNVNAHINETDGQQNVPVLKMNKDANDQQSLFLGQRGTDLVPSSIKVSEPEGPRTGENRDFSKTNQNNFGVLSNTGSFTGKVLTGFQKIAEVVKEPPRITGSNSSQTAAFQSWSSGNFSFPKASDGGSSHLPSSYSKGSESNNSGTNLSVAHFPGGTTEKPLYSLTAPSVSVNPSTKLALSQQRAPTGIRSTEPVPGIGFQLSTQGNSATGKASNYKFHSSKENSGTPSRTGLLRSEPTLSKQSLNVEEMAKELDVLLECIEGPGGFRDASTVLLESSVVALEEGLRTLSDRCRTWKGVMDEGLGDIQQLLDKTVQVLARKFYVEGIVKQATDSQYWDLWDRQRLSSELELKREHILKVNQDLTNQLIELERHFNTLELNKFGENGGAQLGQRAFLSRYGPSRHVHSLHCLHNTMSSQLASAEQLSQCLSKQMAVLSIESPSATKKNVKKELFETIGIPYDGTSFSSPDERKDRDTPSNKRLLISSCSAAVKEHSRRNQSSAVKSAEQESARRRRDSLDRSLASFEPPKTTVKRMVLQEEHKKGSASRSIFSINKQHLDPHMLEESTHAGQKLFTSSSTFSYTPGNKGIHKPTKQAAETPSSHSTQFKSPGMQVLPGNQFSAFSSHFVSRSSPLASQSGVQGSSGLTADPSNSRLTFSQKSSSLPNIESKIDSLPKSSSEMSNPNNKGTPSSIFSVANVKQRLANTENSFSGSGRSGESPFPHLPAAIGQAHSTTTKIVDSETATTKSQPFRITFSSASSLSTSSLSSSSPMMNLSSLSTPSTAMSVGRLSNGSKATADANQTVPLSKSSSTSSSLNLSTMPLFQVREELVPASIPSPHPPMDLRSESPKTEPHSHSVKNELKAEESSTEKTSSSIEPGPPLSGTFSLKLADSVPPAPVPPAPKSEPTTNLLQSENNFNFNGMANFGINKALSSQTGVSFGAPVVSTSTALLSTSGGKDGNSEEDEMEEEAPETSQATELTLGSLGGFGIGSGSTPPNPTSSKPNPFGGTFANSAAVTPMSSPFNMSVPSGELFRPASFNFQSPQATQPSPPTNFSAFSGGFVAAAQVSSGSGGGFGQPAQMGPGQQALGSVLGAFGQSRQLGGTSVPSIGGGFAGNPSNSTGGFANTAGGGFASIASTGGGFGSLASAGGGFAAAAASTAGGGGAFGAFNNQQQAGGGFSAFGAAGAGIPPASDPRFTQMRK